MQRGLSAALAAFLFCGTAQAQSTEPRSLYDQDADCAVYAIAGLPAQSATWDGPCVHGLASGRGTAEFFAHDGSSQIVTAYFRDGAVLDGKGELRWSDNAHYTGDLVGGRADGSGVLIDGQGNRFDGRWKNGAMNGPGTVVWSNGDRFEGELVNGKAEGHGVQIWADGHKYDGPWHNDQPDGQGTVTRVDGSQYAAVFVAGIRQPMTPTTAAPASAAAAPALAAAAPAASPTPVSPPLMSGAPKILDAYAGMTLFGVDRSSVALTQRNGGVLLTITSPEGQARQLIFTVVGDGIGTIADASAASQVIGFFKVKSGGIDAEYADGHFEVLTPSADGLTLTLKNDAGAQYCAAWYPQGHVFSAAERKAAVAAYARRLGVDDGAPQSGCATQGVQPVNVKPIPAAAGIRPTAPPRRGSHAQATSIPASAVAAGAGLVTVPVKPSVVHLIDGAPDAIDTASSAAPAADEAIASRCLKVDSDGTYWGFRNHCGYNVQFAYCLLHGVDAMTACGAEGGVLGSVSANGFGALFSDESLGERGVDHSFRWIGCRGGSGEVVPHLDQPDPASGRCVRASRSLAQGN